MKKINFNYGIVNNVNMQLIIIVAVYYILTKRAFEWNTNSISYYPGWSMTATVFISKRYATTEAEIGSNLKEVWRT